MKYDNLRGERTPEAKVTLRLAGRAVDDPDPAVAITEVLQMMGFIPTPEIEAHRRHPVPRAVPGKRTETAARSAAREPVSDCCGAEMETAGRVTRYYVCTRCDQPCDQRASLNTAFLDKMSLTRNEPGGDHGKGQGRQRRLRRQQVQHRGHGP